MDHIKETDQETGTKRRKRQRASTVLNKEDKISQQQYEENFAEGFMKKLYQNLDENSFHEMLSIIEKFESDVSDLKEQYTKINTVLKEHSDLKREFLGFLQPHQALECGKLMMYYEVCTMKQFICNLMSHFKRQPHFLKKIIHKLCCLTEHENLQQCMVEEAIAPLLQKNSILMQQFLGLLPAEKVPDWYFSCDDMWEEFTIDNEVNDEETFDISQSINEPITGEPKNCIYNCKNNVKSLLCPVCNVKFINGRIYVANGKMLRPANIIFDPSEESENIRRLSGKSDYFPPTSTKSRSHKRVDTCNKDVTEGRVSPFITGAESEEELGENELHTRKGRRKTPQTLKVRFKAVKKKPNNNQTDQVQAEDTAASNDDVSCDDTGREDNGYNSCDDSVPIHLISESNVVLNKEVVELEDMELNISATNMPGQSRGHTVEILKQSKNTRLKTI